MRIRRILFALRIETMPAKNPENDLTVPKAHPSDSAEVAPGVFVVRSRPSGFSAGLLPPLLLVMLGANFLVYRTVASDWRGVFALFSRSSPIPVAKEAPALVLNDPPKPAVPELVAPVPEPVAPVPEPVAPVVPAAPEVAKEEPIKPKVEPPANPLEDIQREAEKTKEKIAELEKLKEEEKAKQDSTATERQKLPTQMDRMLAARQRAVERMLADQPELLRGPLGAIVEGQMREMAEMPRRFMGRDFGNLPQPPFPGLDMGNGGFPPGQQPRRAPWGLNNTPQPPQPGNLNGKEVVRKTPEGTTTVRRFRGPNGSQGMMFEFRSNNPRAAVPPPPEPRRFD
jgi:hypothetical protein